MSSFGLLSDALVLIGATVCACGRSAWYACVGAVDDTFAMDTALIDTVVGARTLPACAWELGLGLEEAIEKGVFLGVEVEEEEEEDW